MAVRHSVSAPVRMVSFPAMKVPNYDGGSRNPSSARPINVIPTADADVFRAVPSVIVWRILHVPGGWRHGRRRQGGTCLHLYGRGRWACLHRDSRWRGIAARADEESYHDRERTQHCLFHQSSYYDCNLAFCGENVNQTGLGDNPPGPMPNPSFIWEVIIESGTPFGWQRGWGLLPGLQASEWSKHRRSWPGERRK
jgi:hypothetical protein